MKAYRLSKCVFKKTLYLLLMLLFFCVCATYPAGVHPAKVLVERYGMYLYDIQKDGTLEVFDINDWEPGAILSLEIEDFSDYSLVTSKKLSLKEIKVINQLITDVKKNSEPNKNEDSEVDGGTSISAVIDKKRYYSTGGAIGRDIAVQNLFNKLEEIAELQDMGMVPLS
ncbi:MAG: hypothetical protein IKM21_04880 [Oscillospiraceae bacterium]|nr:hypothetical protein [Oscillospiraceae bacterium]